MQFNLLPFLKYLKAIFLVNKQGLTFASFNTEWWTTGRDFTSVNLFWWEMKWSEHVMITQVQQNISKIYKIFFLSKKLEVTTVDTLTGVYAFVNQKGSKTRRTGVDFLPTFRGLNVKCPILIIIELFFTFSLSQSESPEREELRLTLNSLSAELHKLDDIHWICPLMQCTEEVGWDAVFVCVREKPWHYRRLTTSKVPQCHFCCSVAAHLPSLTTFT